MTLARSIACTLGNQRLFDPCDLEKLIEGGKGNAHTCNSEMLFSSQHYLYLQTIKNLPTLQNQIWCMHQSDAPVKNVCKQNKRPDVLPINKAQTSMYHQLPLYKEGEDPGALRTCCFCTKIRGHCYPRGEQEWDRRMGRAVTLFVWF